MTRKNIPKKAMRNNIQNNREQILLEFNNKCVACNLEIKEILEVHHLLPVSMGGNNELYNLAVLCPNCHRILHLWLDQKGGDKKVNKYHGNQISYEVYKNLSQLLSRAIRYRNERNEKIIEYYKSRSEDE